MLSIGKVGAGQGDPRYYIDTVASGQEDYYTGQGEAQGHWAGAGAAADDLSGAVEGDAFLRLLSAGDDSARTLLAFDLTFSAPKSVSVLYGIADGTTSRVVRDAHDHAVEQALGYVERHATWTRRGHGGRQRLRGEGLTAALFRHRTSRAGDPQLHTHAVVANRTRAAGRESALDGRALYAHARTAGYLYQAALRHRLTQTVGLDWRPVHKGTADIEGIDNDVLRHFSRRREEILEHLRALGSRSRRAAELATLETRRAKDYDVPVQRLRDEWRARAAELGLGNDELQALLDLRTPGRPVAPDPDVVARQLASPTGVTERASTFDRRDALRAWAESHAEGAPVDQVEALTDAWLGSDATVQLEDGTARAPIGGPRHTTPELLRIEHGLIKQSQDRRGAQVAVPERNVVEAALRADPMLSQEQRDLVRALTLSGDGVQVVRAAAGTGKTSALDVARRAWENSEINVFGCALAARAAVEVESLAGIDACTIAQLRQDLAHGYGLASGSVLVVDEAGMVGSRSLAALADHAAETQSKLVLVGDDRQLPEIDAGGGFRALAEQLGAVELHQSFRQVEGWDRAALHALRHGKVDGWSEAYRDHGRLVSRRTAAELRRTLVDDWWTATKGGQDDTVMIAHRRADVAELNALARSRMHADAQLGETEVFAGGRDFAVGDKVIARRNDRRLGMVNGTRGDVVDVGSDTRSLRVRFGGQHDRQVDGTYLDEGYLDHGYALTAHAAQGATVDRAFVLGSDELYREWGYTALSRHRFEARFYVVSTGSVERALPGMEPNPDALRDDIMAVLARSRQQESATEVLERGFGARVDFTAPEGINRRTSRPEDRQSIREREANAARTRALELEAEANGTKPWQRSRRRDLSRLADAQREAAARWLRLQSGRDDASEADARPGTATSMHGAPGHTYVEPGQAPVGLAGRDAWCRTAGRLLAEPTLERNEANLADRGM